MADWTHAADPIVKPAVKALSKALAFLPGPWWAWLGGAAAIGVVTLFSRSAGAAEALPDRPAGAPPMLKLGASGPWVSYLQSLLGVPVTGAFDAATDAAVRSYQDVNSPPADGIVGAGTWGALGVTGAPSNPVPQPQPGGGGGGSPPPPNNPPQTPPSPTVGNPFGLSDGIAAREAQMLSIISAGNVEHQWAPLDYSASGHAVHLLVSRRALALNDGSNKLILSMTYAGAQKALDLLGGAMLTTRISDEIYKQQSGVKVFTSQGVPPSQHWQGDGTDNSGSKTFRMYDQSNYLDKRVAELGGGSGGPGGSSALIANEGKDWVITRRFWKPPQGTNTGGNPPSHSANFGWYYKTPLGTSKSPGGLSVVQSIGLAHDMNHADYSQLVRAVLPSSLTIDGVPWDWGAALADPSVSALIQDEGGTIPSPRHPDL